MVRASPPRTRVQAGPRRRSRNGGATTSWSPFASSPHTRPRRTPRPPPPPPSAPPTATKKRASKLRPPPPPPPTSTTTKDQPRPPATASPSPSPSPPRRSRGRGGRELRLHRRPRSPRAPPPPEHQRPPRNQIHHVRRPQDRHPRWINASLRIRSSASPRAMIQNRDAVPALRLIRMPEIAAPLIVWFRAERAGSALAASGIRCVGCARQRVHAPADARQPGHPPPAGVARPVADADRAGGRGPGRSSPAVGESRLPAPGALVASRRGRGPRPARRDRSARRRGAARPDRDRRLHSARGGSVRVR